MSDLFTQVGADVCQPETTTPVTVIHSAEVLGRPFQIYGTAENPLFLATDVAEWIEHSNVSSMLSSVDEDEKEYHKHSLENSGAGNPNKWFLTENGLYEVLMLSRKPIAKQFKKQVKEILHEVRTKGGYIAAKAEESLEELCLRTNNALMAAIERQKKQLEEARATIARKDDQLELAAPKVAFVETFATSTKGNILVRDFAGMLARSLGMRGFGQNALFAWLKKHGFMNLNRYPSQYAKDLMLLESTEGFHVHHDGTTGVHHCTRITPKGQTYFFEKIKKQFEEEGRWW